MRPCFHPMRCFPHKWIVHREWKIGKSSVDSLLVAPLSGHSSEDGGAVSLRPGPCSKLFGRTVGDTQEKVPVFDAGTSVSHDAPSPNRAAKYLCVRLTRPACSRWHVSAWFDRATTEGPRDGPNHSGAAELTSSGHLTGGFAWEELRLASVPSHGLG